MFFFITKISLENAKEKIYNCEYTFVKFFEVLKKGKNDEVREMWRGSGKCEVLS